MAYHSDPGDLALHGVRVLGFASVSKIAGRFGIDADAAEEALLDYDARGWARHTSFAGGRVALARRSGRPFHESPVHHRGRSR